MATTVRPLRVAPSPRLVFTPAPRTLDDEMDDVARGLQHDVPDLTSKERQFLKDVQRTPSAYPMKPLDRLICLSARAKTPAIRFALAERIHGLIVGRVGVRPMVCADDVLDAENASNPVLDNAVRRWMANRTEANRRAALEAAHAQKANTQLVIDLLESSAPVVA